MSGTFFCGEKRPSSADSRRASCQLLVKEWVLNTGKLPSGGLPRSSVVKLLTISTGPQLFTVEVKHQTKQKTKHDDVILTLNCSIFMKKITV